MRLEISHLKNVIQDYEGTLGAVKRESEGLRQMLEEARAQNHLLEDELEIRSQEIGRGLNQIREIERTKLELQKLAENEVRCFGFVVPDGFSKSAS